MIDSFRDDELEQFFRNNIVGKGIPASIADSLFRRLQMLDDAQTTADLKSPPGNRFEPLLGKLAGKFSIRVNKKWRLIFEWGEKNGASAVYLDPHDYKD